MEGRELQLAAWRLTGSGAAPLNGHLAMGKVKLQRFEAGFDPSVSLISCFVLLD